MIWEIVVLKKIRMKNGKNIVQNVNVNSIKIKNIFYFIQNVLSKYFLIINYKVLVYLF